MLNSRRPLPALVALLAAAALAQGTQAAEPVAGKKLTLLFTGDNGGEVAPCG